LLPLSRLSYNQHYLVLIESPTTASVWRSHFFLSFFFVLTATASLSKKSRKIHTKDRKMPCLATNKHKKGEKVGEKKKMAFLFGIYCYDYVT